MNNVRLTLSKDWQIRFNLSWFTKLAREANHELMKHRSDDWLRGYYQGRRSSYMMAARAFKGLL